MIVPLNLPAGCYRNGTEYQAKGRWRDVNLVRWREGAMMPVGGWTAYSGFAVTTGENILSTARNAIAWVDNSGARRLLWSSSIFVNVMADNGTVTELTPAGYTAGSSSERYSVQFGIFGQIPIMCQGTDGRIWEWDLNTANNMTAVTNAPTGCSGVLVTDERFIFALGAGGEPRRIEWCDRGDRTVWTPAATNQAGGYDLDTEGEILFGIQLRGEVLIVTSKDCWTARYVGYPDVYVFNRVGSCTAVSGVCGVRVDDVAYWMGERCFYAYTGGSVGQVPCEVADFLFADISDDGVLNNPDKAKVFAWHNSEFNEVWWHYISTSNIVGVPPSSWDDCDKYVAYNYRERHWHTGSAPFSVVADRVPFDQPIGFYPLRRYYTEQYDSDPGYTLGTNWRIAGGVLDQSAPTASTASYAIASTVSGAKYLLYVQIANRTAGTLTVRFGTSTTTTANGGQYFVLTPDSSAELLEFIGDGTWDGDIEQVLIYRALVHELESGYVHESGTTPAPYAETGPLDIGDGERRVHVLQVIPDEQTAGELTYTFKHREYPNATQTTETVVTAAAPTDVRFSGREFTMKVAPGSNVDWRCGVTRLDVAIGGKR